MVSRESVQPTATLSTVMETWVTQSGDAGGNGLSKFHWTPTSGAPAAQADVDAVHLAVYNFYNGLKTNFPPSVGYNVQVVCRALNVADAAILGEITSTKGNAPIQGAATGNPYPAGAGLRINWSTSQVVGRRLLRGCTFLVPLANSCFTGGGNVSGTTLTAVSTALGQLSAALTAANCQLVIWHRPTKLSPAAGVLGVVTANKMGTNPALLRSRSR